ncbi:MAG: ATP-binding cassette domain-containing protein [Planctomycetia bacterium]|nr:ATP-binding cassette domain-containing protein [Planctomycetia bacterium]
MKPLFEIRDWKVYFPFTQGNLFHRVKGNIRAVDGVSFYVNSGETFGLVGESGCGKSTIARSVLGLVKPTGGEMFWEGEDTRKIQDFHTTAFRRKLQMIFQDPYASLNPRMTVGKIIAEPMNIFRLYPASERPLRVMQLMDRVGLNPCYLNRYPHEFSGGQRQRIGIARALAVQPQLIFCDEAVSALDVSIQAQVVNLLEDLKEELQLSYVFIAHDLSVVRHISDRIGVMYLGRLVEVAPTREIYESPRHPYTRALLSAVPIPDPVRQRERQRQVLQGEISSAEVLEKDGEPARCAFAPRCPCAQERCFRQQPVLKGEEHQVACFLHDS